MGLIDEICVKGGMLNCIEEGWVQTQIMDSAYKYQKEVESKKRIIVGVNEHIDKEDELEEELTEIDEKAIQEQINRLKHMKKKRGNINNYLSVLAQKASDDNANLMPHIIEAVSAKVTIGEICNTLRKVWGEYKPKEIL